MRIKYIRIHYSFLVQNWHLNRFTGISWRNHGNKNNIFDIYVGVANCYLQSFVSLWSKKVRSKKRIRKKTTAVRILFNPDLYFHYSLLYWQTEMHYFVYLYQNVSWVTVCDRRTVIEALVTGIHFYPLSTEPKKWVIISFEIVIRPLPIKPNI